jgi:hypothetical protein
MPSALSSLSLYRSRAADRLPARLGAALLLRTVHTERRDSGVVLVVEADRVARRPADRIAEERERGVRLAGLSI